MTGLLPLRVYSFALSGTLTGTKRLKTSRTVELPTLRDGCENVLY